MSWKVVNGDGSPGSRWNILLVVLLCLPLDVLLILLFWAAMEVTRWLGAP